MHCAYCRHENPRSSRFCVNCSAVLVESGRDGRPRRVLRPWGLLRQAPLTVTPSMPDVAEARAAHLGARAEPARSHRLALLALAAVAVIGGVVFVYAQPAPMTSSGVVAAASQTHNAALQASEPVRALTPTRLAVEVPLASPPLRENAPVPPKALPAPTRTLEEARKAPQDAKDEARRVAQRAALTQPASWTVAAVF